MERLLFLVCLFECFFFRRQQIYKAIAAIFWQSGSYVLGSVRAFSEFFTSSVRNQIEVLI